MSHKQVILHKSDCGKASIYMETDMSLAAFHDFMLKEKGWAVDRMVAIHNEQVQEAKEKIPPVVEPINSEECAEVCAEVV